MKLHIKVESKTVAYCTYLSEANIAVHQGTGSIGPVSRVTAKKEAHYILGTAFFPLICMCMQGNLPTLRERLIASLI